MPEDEEEIETEEEETTEEPELILGKFKSQEELAKAYEESQAEMRRAQQRAHDLEQAVTTQQAAPQNPPIQPVADDDPWADAFDSTDILAKRVTDTVYGALGQYQHITRNADANIENIILERESDPMFKEVGRAFRAELKRVEPQYMLDPNQAAQIAENIYNTVCGRHARTILAKTRENPSDRKKYLESLGVEEPQVTDDREPADDVNRRDLEMLRSIGLKEKKDIEGAVEGYRKRGNE